MDTLTTIEAILHVLGDLSPLALMTLLGAIVLLIVHKRGPVQTIKDNHLTHIEGHLERIANATEQNGQKLEEIAMGIEFVKGRIT